MPLLTPPYKRQTGWVWRIVPEPLTFALNRVAGTLSGGVPTLSATAAANKWAATTGLDLCEALNVKAGNTFPDYLALPAVVNQLAGTTGLGVQEAAGKLNNPPTAAFTATPTGLTVAFDATGSTDDSGIDSYSWDFGDNGSGSGVTTSHTYAAADTYTVTLTVTDDDGDTASVSHDVTVTA